MIIESLRIENVRNHRSTELACPPGILVLWGANGAGKTAILESIALICTARSFNGSQDKTVITKGASFCKTDGSVLRDGGSRHSVSVSIALETGRKKILIDNAHAGSSVELFGRFPMVYLVPDHKAITAGAPAERRAFLDYVVSQHRRSYLLDLIEYRRILKQRNALLQSDTAAGSLKTMLEPWDISLAAHAVRIIRERLRFLEAFIPFFARMYASIAPEDEQPSLRYVSTDIGDAFSAEAESRFLASLRDAFPTDYRRQTTTIGPHRDDVEILLNGRDVRTTASEGQHKSLLIAIKVAEFLFLNEMLEDSPVFLLDDVFSELDDARLKRTIEIVGGLGQTFITTANETFAHALPYGDGSNAAMFVENGTVAHEAVSS